MSRSESKFEHRRLRRERKTVAAMQRIYCRANHGTARGLCAECDELKAYSEARLAACPYGWEKPPCSECTIHCYKPERREQIRAVMRYAGPRMFFRHPILAVHHLLNKRKTNRVSDTAKV